MSWVKLANPKPSRGNELPPDGVRITSHSSGGSRRLPWIRIRVGKDAARRGSLHATKHNVHVLAGAAEEKGQVAIVCDADTGNFVAAKQPDGSYVITINARAAEGQFATEFDPFSVAGAKVIGDGKTPAFITFPVPSHFLEAVVLGIAA